MKKCNNCGQPISFTDKFCGNCGEITPPSDSNVSSFSSYLLSTISKPLTTMSNPTEEFETKLFYALIAMLSILYGIVNCFISTLLLEEIFKLSKNIFGNMLYDIELNYLRKDLLSSIPFGDIFTVSIFFALISIFGLIVTNEVILKFTLKQSNVSFENVTKIVVPSLLPFMCLYIISLILLGFSFPLYIICCFSGFILSAFTLYKGLHNLCPNLSEDKLSISIISSYIVVALLKYFVIITL